MTIRTFSALLLGPAILLGAACNGATQTIAVENNTDQPVTVTMELESGYSARGFETGECSSDRNDDFKSPFEVNSGASECIEGGSAPASPVMKDRFQTLRIEQGDTTCLDRSGDSVPEAFDGGDRPTVSISNSDCS